MGGLAYKAWILPPKPEVPVLYLTYWKQYAHKNLVKVKERLFWLNIENSACVSSHNL